MRRLKPIVPDKAHASILVWRNARCQWEGCWSTVHARTSQHIAVQLDPLQRSQVLELGGNTLYEAAPFNERLALYDWSHGRISGTHH
mgnify:FL=1